MKKLFENKGGNTFKVSDEPKIEEATHGIIAYTKIDEGNIGILHCCLYWSKPNEDCFKSLKEELNTDPEFGLVGRMDKDVFLMEAPFDIVEIYKGKII